MADERTVYLDGESLTLEDVMAVARREARASLSASPKSAPASKKVDVSIKT